MDPDQNGEANSTLENLFSYHAPTPEQVEHYNAIREKARELAYVLDQHCPASADRTSAMRQLQDAVMTANRSIACQGESYR